MKYFIAALGLLFIALKLVGAINWSWIWVLAPLWSLLILVIVCTYFYDKMLKS
jgi:energy-coupling factor transporter transmembrane protein EcfT